MSIWFTDNSFTPQQSLLLHRPGCGYKCTITTLTHFNKNRNTALRSQHTKPPPQKQKPVQPRSRDGNMQRISEEGDKEGEAWICNPRLSATQALMRRAGGSRQIRPKFSWLQDNFSVFYCSPYFKIQDALSQKTTTAVSKLIREWHTNSSKKCKQQFLIKSRFAASQS